MIHLDDVYEIFGFAPDIVPEVTRSRGKGFIEMLLCEANPAPDIWPELEFIGGL